MTPHLFSAAELRSFPESMSQEETFQWIQSRMNRSPDAADIYELAVSMYHAGEYVKAAAVLEIYVKIPGAAIKGIHLLGYSHYMSGNLSSALTAFGGAVTEGMESDWQMLVELHIELDESKK